MMFHLEDPILHFSDVVLEAKDVTIEAKHFLIATKSITVASITLNNETKNSPGIKVKCPENYNANVQLIKSLLLYLSCTPCHRGLYSNKRGKGRIPRKRFVKLNHFKNYNELHNDTCGPCPTVSVCNGRNISRSNFYGFKKHGKLKFLPCPDRYCCSGDTNPSKTITTCNKNRESRLCGRCKNGTYTNLFNNDCISVERFTKTNKTVFWLFFLSTPIFLSLILIFVKDLKIDQRCCSASVKQLL